MGARGKVLSAAAAAGTAAAAAEPRMDSNLSGFTDVRSLHYHGIQSNSDASEWISRGMRGRGFGGWRGRGEGDTGTDRE